MPEAPVSWGELIDKITILEIKAQRLTAEAGLANVRHELAALTAAAAERDADPRLAEFKADLAEVNEALWEIEDAIREKEQAADFGPEFVALARSVYRRNDERAAIKRRINLAFGSEYIEEKSYRGMGSI
jgi:hypothetical protein